MSLNRMSAFFLALAVTAALTNGCARKTDEPLPPKPLTLTYANFPPPATFPCVQMERWAREVESRSGSRVRVQTFPSGTLLAAKNIFDGVADGTADIGCFAMSYQPGRFPVTEAIDLPHFFPSAAVATRVLLDTFQEYDPAEFKSVKVLALFTCPPAVVMSSKPVKAVSDLAGLELRSSGTAAEAVRRLGGIPVAMPQSETPDALQKGVVKGNVSSAEVLMDMNYAAYCPFVYPAELPVVSFAVVMNAAKYNALAPDLRAILDGLVVEHSLWTADYVDQHVSKAIAWGKENRNLAVSEVSDADRAALREAFDPLLEDFASRVTKSGINGTDLLRFVRVRRDAHLAAEARP